MASIKYVTVALALMGLSGMPSYSLATESFAAQSVSIGSASTIGNTAALQGFDSHAEAKAYLEDALLKMEELDFKRYSRDWPAIKRAVFEKYPAPLYKTQVYNAINYAVELTEEKHTSFVPAYQLAQIDDYNKANQEAITSFMLKDDIAYLKVMGYLSLDDNIEHGQAYLHTVLRAIQQVDSASLSGWVIDLRFHRGGIMSWIYAAMSPFYPRGRLAYTVNASGNKRWVINSKNHLSSLAYGIDTPGYQLKSPSAKVAVLINGGTASMGEVTGLTLQQNQAKLFGKPSYGVISVVTPNVLLDDSQIWVTSDIFLDLAGNPVDTVLTPDFLVDSPLDENVFDASLLPAPEDDAVIQAALAWIDDKQVASAD